MIDLTARQTSPLALRPTDPVPTDTLDTEGGPTDLELNRATARRLADLHTVGADELTGHCWWCLKTWPCPDKVWADRVLRPDHWSVRSDSWAMPEA